MAKRIASLKNDNIKKIVLLRKGRIRREQGLTVIDGVKELQMAIKANAFLQELYFCKKLCVEGVEELIGQAKNAYEVTDQVFEKISYGEHRDGIVAVVKPKMITLESIKLPKNALCVVLEGIEKPGNLGAILRTCDGANVDAVFVCEAKTDLFNPNTIRSSLGAIFSVPVIMADSKDVLSYLKENKVKVLSATPDATEAYVKSNLKQSVAIAMGEEHKGLSDYWLDQSDLQVSIPMLGWCDSLNVSVATAVVLYEAVRQRSK
ncbi:MAG: TrmH family RNA methyltransferase [Candidatus Omnitrophota bacterium]|jgi:TrmH family RNA methyltransferase